MDTVPKILNLGFDPNIYKTTNVDQTSSNFVYNYTKLKQAGWDPNSDLCMDTIPKQLSFKFNPNIDKTTNLNEHVKIPLKIILF